MSDDVFSGRDGANNSGPGRSVQVGRDSRITTDLDTVFGLLEVARRRYLLYYLYEMDGEVTELEGVVEAVYACEAAGADSGDAPPRQRIRTDLHHMQLPTLEQANVIEYDHRQGTIRFSGLPSIEEWLEHARYRELD